MRTLVGGGELDVSRRVAGAVPVERVDLRVGSVRALGSLATLGMLRGSKSDVMGVKGQDADGARRSAPSAPSEHVMHSPESLTGGIRDILPGEF